MKNTFLPFLIVLSLLTSVFQGCVKDEFDDPPVELLPILTANKTIAEVKALHTLGTPASIITDDIIIEGTVIADDQSGNYYKTFVIQDASGGVDIRVNATNVYNEYPIGRKVWVKCKDLYIGDYNGVFQISGSATGGIEQALMKNYIIGGAREQFVTPAPKAISELSTANISTLVELSGVEFSDIDQGQPYADAVNRLSVNRTVQDCNGNTIVLRTSGYANFAAVTTPGGKGKIVGVCSVFGSTYQLFIRDTSDVNMPDNRCDGTGGGGTGNEVLKTIQEIRDIFTGGATVAPAETKIKGIVISDIANGNFDTKNMVIQDASAGIVVRFNAAHTFAVGDEVEVITSNAALSEYKGLLQISASTGAAKKTGTGTVTPQTITLGELTTNFANYESELVKIETVTIGGGGTYSGSKTVTDATGTSTLYTRSAATFAGTAVPTGEVGITAVVGEFDTPQLSIRTTADVTGGGSSGCTTPNLVTIQSLRALFTGTTTSAPTCSKIKGIVTSDLSGNNITSRNITIQDASAGITVRFTANNTFAMGTEVEIDISSMEISEYNGLLQLNNVPNANATTISQGNTVTAQVVTVQQVLDNLEDYESELVQINSASLTGGPTYVDVTNVGDASGGSIQLYTRSAATFAGTNIPTGTVTVKAVVSQFNTAQLNLRNATDVQ